MIMLRSRQPLVALLRWSYSSGTTSHPESRRDAAVVEYSMIHPATLERLSGFVLVMHC
jgi:hypothetical protein